MKGQRGRLVVGALLAAVLLALGTARVLDLPSELVASGLYGYNALLIGLGGESGDEHAQIDGRGEEQEDAHRA